MNETTPSYQNYIASLVTMEDGSVKIYRADVLDIHIARAIDRETADKIVTALNEKAERENPDNGFW